MEQTTLITEQSSTSTEIFSEPKKNPSRRRKPLRPWPLSSRPERTRSESFSPSTMIDEVVTTIFQCDSCEFHCQTSDEFDEHQQKHVDDELDRRRSDSFQTKSNKSKIHRCRQCSFISHSKEEYWTHHRVHIRTEKILECPSCPFVTEYKHHLEYHLRNHLGSKPFKCSKCDYACVNLSMLRSHKKSHYRHLVFKCSDCPFESKEYQSIEEHFQIEGHQLHHDEQVEEFLQEYFSTNLPKRTSTKNKKSQRQSSSSSVDENCSSSFFCQLCNYRAESKEFFDLHLFQHTFDPSIVANPIQQWMDFFQGQKINLEQSIAADDSHRRISSIDQQTQVDQWQLQGLFECAHCQMIFKDFAMYCTHKQFHSSSTNPFRCAQCGEQKVNQYDFFVHITQQAHDLS